MKKLAFLGQVFGNLTVLSFAYKKGTNEQWLCHCVCGKEKVVNRSNLKNGNTRSCGCMQGEAHGMSGVGLYDVWVNMRGRCSNPNNSDYVYYGKRGIEACPDWKKFSAFYAWANSHGYKEGLTIERINNDGNYDPQNCKWIPKEEQSRNKRTTWQISLGGEIHTIREWSERMGIACGTLRYRLRKGWGITDVLLCPLMPGKRPPGKEE